MYVYKEKEKEKIDLVSIVVHSRNDHKCVFDRCLGIEMTGRCCVLFALLFVSLMELNSFIKPYTHTLVEIR